VKPGRHLVKIDGHSLPEGTQFISEESYLVKINAGPGWRKANFAVCRAVVRAFGTIPKRPQCFGDAGPGHFAAGPGGPNGAEVLKLGVGILERQPSF